MLLFLNQQGKESNNEFIKETALNDSTNYVDISELGIRVIYPKCVQPKKTELFRTNGVLSLSIGSYAKGNYWNEINMSIELATQNSIKQRSDALAKNNAKDEGGDYYYPETEQEFLNQKQIFIESERNKYYDDYYWVGNRKYGNRLWSAENYGNVIECRTYLDGLQITVSLMSQRELLYQRALRILDRIKFSKP